jgi:hypothetical protein
MKKVSILIVLVLGCFIESKAQKVALKSNLLYDATTTMNLGLEFGLARKWTLDVPVNYNPWKPDNGRRLRHWGIQPEVRYWFCERFVRSSECMDIMRTSMSVGSRTGRLLVRICRTAAIRDICMAGVFPSVIHGF